LQVLTKEIAYKELQKFFQDTPFVLFGTGMSCAVDERFGMDYLKEHLIECIKRENLSNSQNIEWDSVLESLNDGADFETAMNSIKDISLIKIIVEITGNFIGTLDFEYSQKILNNEINWPASTLFKKIVNGLYGTDHELHVATPNYDLLAEYAFEKYGIPYINGFYGSINRKLNWEKSKRNITYIENVPHGKKIERVLRKEKHITLYKVHGSLNLFLINDHLIENNAWLYTKPENIERIIITPGISKYEKLHLFRNELLGKYDSVIERHNFFLFLGFGFNDTQLNNHTIINKLQNQNSNGLVITKYSNERIEKILQSSENLWHICSNDKIGTIIKNKKYSEPLIINDKELWKVDIFVSTILGD